MKLTVYQVTRIKRLLNQSNTQEIIKTIEVCDKADLAGLMASLDKKENQDFLESLLVTGKASIVLAEMPAPALKELFTYTSEQHILAIFHEGKADDLVYFLDFFDEEKKKELVEKIPLIKKIQIQQFLNYPEDTVGRLMSSPVFSVPSHFTVGKSIELLRERAKEEPIYYIYCTNRNNQLIGVVSMRQLAVSEENLQLKSILSQSLITVHTHTSLWEAAQTVAHYGFLAIPVVEKNMQLLGLIPKDAVIDIIQEQATLDLYARAGLEENDRVFTPAWDSVKYRIPWICLNLFMAVMVSSVVSLFEQTMSRLIILASLKNIVTGIGGNTAIQTLTVMTRGLAIGDFRFTPIKKALLKEFIVGCVLGLTAGLGAFLITYIWKQSLLVSIVIFISMFLNSLVAVLAGALIPIILHRFKRDPAIGSGVLVTTITDIFGFFSFLGIAYLGLTLIGEHI